MTLGYLDRLIRILGLTSLTVIYLPIISLVTASFFVPDPTDLETKVLSLEGFRLALNHRELQNSLYSSTQLALFTALTTTLFALILAIGLQGKNNKYIEVVRNIFALPLMLPEIIIGLSLLIWFVFIHITLGSVSLWISHVSFTLPYAVVLLTLGLENIDQSLFEAGKDLGASNSVIFRSITFPLLKPSLISIFLLSFVISFDDFLISYFTNGPGNDTLPVKLYSLMRFGMSPELKSISTLILAVSFLVTVSLFRFLPKKAKGHREI